MSTDHTIDRNAHNSHTTSAKNVNVVTDDPAPTTPNQLHDWLRRVLSISLPRRPILAGHQSPFDFLAHTFLAPAGHSALSTPADSVLWAARGAGKTYLGALLVFLDMVFRPRINIRILSGSLAQALRLFAHLKTFIRAAHYEDKVQGRIHAHSLTLVNQSTVEVLAQSETSIRGTRVQRIVCDEVDLFTPSLFDAAQLVTRSATCGEHHLLGSVVCLSTLHRPQGTMSRLIADCANGARSLFKWSVIDSLEHCPSSRACSSAHPHPDAAAIPLPILNPPPADACPLHNECQGRAKHTDPSEPGHFFITDAIALKSRVSHDTWKSEMLCQGVSRAHAVYDQFHPDIHIVTHLDMESHFRIGCPNPLDPERAANLSLVCGMDFGLRHPTVILWGILDSSPQHPSILYIVDELRTTGQTTEANAARIAGGLSAHTTPADCWVMPQMVAIDPSGNARHTSSTYSDAQHLHRAGLKVVNPDNAIERGIRAVQARIAPAQGSPRLFIHNRCQQLISDLLTYRYHPDLPHSSTPVKDGPDHGCDALRYLVVSIEQRTRPAKCANYLH
jgi:hypothetical protein